MNEYLNKIIHGDCLEVMKSIPDKSIDLVLTDPPYGINFNSNYRKKSYLKSVNGILNDNIDNEDFLSLVTDELNRVLKDNSHIYWFTRWDKIPEQLPLLSRYFKVKNSLVWMKNNWSMGDLKGAYASQYEVVLYAQKGRRLLNEFEGRSRHTDILQYNRIPSNKLLHSHEKPMDLLEFLINKSTKEKEVLLDCFIGSGTTAISALNTGRFFIGIEKEKEYVDIANKRIEEYYRNRSIL